MKLPEVQGNNPDLQNISSLALAYIGDAVFELLARIESLNNGNITAGKLHKSTVDMVAAKHQAAIAKKIEDSLTNEEKDVLKRGRNAHSQVPKSASVEEYRLSTALESLFGYLYLTGNIQRVIELFNMGQEIEL